ncbi:MAG: allantoinase PuuE [Planctomycetia bacterium]|jgi:allantoinase|nr:allantoinase PuuE [Planctomycetia bacterium]
MNKRDMVGYANNAPYAAWPRDARIAVQFVLNFEEGAENCILNGDSSSETFLSDIIDAKPYNDRHMSVESLFEYGSRIGFWRILSEFNNRKLPLTVFACGLALQNNKLIADALATSDHEIAGHGWRWINYQEIDYATEKNHIRKTMDAIKDVTGTNPAGWYTGRDSPNTRNIILEENSFLYDSDYYGDELPFWYPINNGDDSSPHLIIPYTLDCNDMRFLTINGISSGDCFFTYLKDTFDFLYALGDKSPRMMTIGLHGRIIGRPGRFVYLQKFLDYINGFNKVWIARRKDIAAHWYEKHPYRLEW